MRDEETRVLIHSIKRNAQRLGLTWTRRFGTVESVDGLTARVVMDGDSVGTSNSGRLRAISLVGPLLPTSRVVVDSVPPDGHYVAGVLSNAPYAGQRLLAQALVAATGDLTLGTATADVPGCTVTGTLLVDGFFEATAVCDFQYTVAGAARAAGTLTVDGVAQNGQPIFDAGATTLGRATVSQQWYGALTAGDHTIKLRAAKNAAAATIQARLTSTTLLVKFWIPTL